MTMTLENFSQFDLEAVLKTMQLEDTVVEDFVAENQKIFDNIEKDGKLDYSAIESLLVQIENKISTLNKNSNEFTGLCTEKHKALTKQKVDRLTFYKDVISEKISLANSQIVMILEEKLSQFNLKELLKAMKNDSDLKHFVNRNKEIFDNIDIKKDGKLDYSAIKSLLKQIEDEISRLNKNIKVLSGVWTKEGKEKNKNLIELLGQRAKILTAYKNTISKKLPFTNSEIVMFIVIMIVMIVYLALSLAAIVHVAADTTSNALNPEIDDIDLPDEALMAQQEEVTEQLSQAGIQEQADVQEFVKGAYDEACSLVPTSFYSEVKYVDPHGIEHTDIDEFGSEDLTMDHQDVDFMIAAQKDLHESGLENSEESVGRYALEKSLYLDALDIKQASADAQTPLEQTYVEVDTIHHERFSKAVESNLLQKDLAEDLINPENDFLTGYHYHLSLKNTSNFGSVRDLDTTPEDLTNSNNGPSI